MLWVDVRRTYPQDIRYRMMRCDFIFLQQLAQLGLKYRDRNIDTVMMLTLLKCPYLMMSCCNAGTYTMS